MTDEPPALERAKIGPGASMVTVEYAPRTLTMHCVSENELEHVASMGLSNSVHLAFFGLSLGALTAFGIVLTTTPTLSPLTHASYVALTAVALGGSLLFGVQAAIDYRRIRRELTALKRGVPTDVG